MITTEVITATKTHIHRYAVMMLLIILNLGIVQNHRRPPKHLQRLHTMIYKNVIIGIVTMSQNRNSGRHNLLVFACLHTGNDAVQSIPYAHDTHSKNWYQYSGTRLQYRYQFFERMSWALGCSQRCPVLQTGDFQ